MRLMIAVIAAAVAVPAAAAWAQDQQTREERIVVRVGPGEATEIPESGLSRDAFLARQGEAFARLDTDGNGVVSREEMTANAGLDGNRQMMWSSDGGEIRIVRRGDGADRTVDIQGEPGEGRRIFIRRPDGQGPHLVEGVGVEDGPGGSERQVFVFTSNGEGRMDANGDGRLSFEEMAAPLRRHFERQDANHDGFLDRDEQAPVGAMPPMPPAPPEPPAPPPAPRF